MKRLIITESQLNRLEEARMDGFRIDALRNMPYAKKVKYCRQWLGFPIGNGSSRMVFQLDDDSVLKLAKNEKGVAQNELEYRMGNDWYISHMFPEVMNGSDEKGLWVVSEYVLPAKKADFKNVLGVPWDLTVRAIRNMHPVNGNWKVIHDIYEKYADNEKFIEFLNGINDYISSYDVPIPDLCALMNWGLTKDGELKILDFGLDEYIWKKYYRK